MKIKILQVINEPFYYDRGDLKEFITDRKCEVELNGVNIGFYGYPQIDEIYDAIKKSKPLYYPKCVIEDFSLNDFKEKNNISKYESVKFIDSNFTCSIFYLKENKEIDFYNSLFEGHLSFLNTIFCDGDVIFSDCEFTDPKMTDFCRAQFGNGNKYFSAVYHSEKVNFIGVNFGNGNVQFTEAEFKSKKIDFAHSEFGDGNLLFEEIQFEADRIRFNNCSFGKGEINFVGTDFGDADICFNNSTFKSESIYFCSTRFGVGGLDFTNTKLHSTFMDFENAQFGDLDIRFDNMHCYSIKFDNCYLFGDIFFNKTQISGVLSLINFRTDGSIYFDLLNKKLNELIYGQNVTFAKKSQQFLLLKQNFNKLGHYDDEDSAYVEFKRCQAKAHLKDSKKKSFIKKISGFLIYCGNRLMFDFVVTVRNPEVFSDLW